MHASWNWRIRFIRKHLLMLLLAFGWLFVQSQVAIASHDCQLNPMGEMSMIQHLDHQMSPHSSPEQMAKMSLCGQHCAPDAVQKTLDYTSLVALPVASTLAVVMPLCAEEVVDEWSQIPSASAGPPATIRFCRFRE